MLILGAFSKSGWDQGKMGELYFLQMFYFFGLREHSIFCGSLGRFQVLCKGFQVLRKGFRNWPAAGATHASSGNFAENLKTLPRTWKVLREPQKIECSRSPKKKNICKKYMFSHFTLISATLRESFKYKHVLTLKNASKWAILVGLTLWFQKKKHF